MPMAPEVPSGDFMEVAVSAGVGDLLGEVQEVTARPLSSFRKVLVQTSSVASVASRKFLP
jgi:hypothetical protein